MNEVIELKPKRHWQFHIWEGKHGYLAEAREGRNLMWEYETDDLKMIMRIIARTLGANSDNS